MTEPILRLPLRCDGQEIWDASTLLRDDGQPIGAAWGDTLAIAKLRAAEIVRRCNAHDELLAACQKAEYVFRIPSISSNRDEQGALQALREAITNATKGQP